MHRRQLLKSFPLAVGASAVTSRAAAGDMKKQTVLLANRSRVIKSIALTFADATRFVYIK